MTPRKKAFLLLEDILQNKKYANLALKNAFGPEFSAEDKAFITALVYGVLEKLLQLDYIIDHFAKGRVQPKIRTVLRMGIYQILYMDKIPDHAACSESVRLAGEIGKSALGGYINGVLRSVVRSRENIPYPDPEKDAVAYLSVRTSCPRELVQELMQDWGAEEAEKILACMPEHFTTFRIHTNRISVADFLKKLEEEHIPFRPGVLLPFAIGTEGNKLFESPLFREGSCSPQSEASMLAVLALAPQKGERILDACAAPGGKTVFIAQMAENGQVVALDKHAHRVELIAANAKRCGLSQSIFPQQADAAQSLEELGAFDRVLVDAPCSGLGVWGSKPEIKYNFSSQSAKELEEVQGRLLRSAARQVKAGGVLVYSTCTIRKGENQQIVESFLKENPDFTLDSLTPFMPQKLQKHSLESGMLQLFAHRDGTEGFFIARMRRKSHG